VIAVARPHHVAWTGEPVTLDASLSWTADGGALRCEWAFCDGSRAEGPTAERVYERAGVYSEILKVTDSAGRCDYDFAIVEVADREHPELIPPGIHAAFAPSLGLRPGDAVTFKVRAFGTTHGDEAWDFGDGSAPVTVRSDGNVDRYAPDGYAVTEHSFAKPGDYIVTVRRSNEHGQEAVARLYVPVG
jgi:hypothetical protein